MKRNDKTNITSYLSYAESRLPGNVKGFSLPMLNKAEAWGG